MTVYTAADVDAAFDLVDEIMLLGLTDNDSREPDAPHPTTGVLAATLAGMLLAQTEDDGNPFEESRGLREEVKRGVDA